jgi:hypothetical protein
MRASVVLCVIWMLLLLHVRYSMIAFLLRDFLLYSEIAPAVCACAAVVLPEQQPSLVVLVLVLAALPSAPILPF